MSRLDEEGLSRLEGAGPGIGLSDISTAGGCGISVSAGLLLFLDRTLAASSSAVQNKGFRLDKNVVNWHPSTNNSKFNTTLKKVFFQERRSMAGENSYVSQISTFFFFF